jgi:soluble lytic murein transglycosylase-like protein
MFAPILAIFAVLPAELPDMNVLAQIESNGSPKAVSPCGARGLCQIMPATWNVHASKNEKWQNPIHNKQVARRYLLWIQATLKKWGDPGWDDPSHLLACYNGGIGRFRKVGFDITRMPRETRRYIQRYMTLTQNMQKNNKNER